MRQLDAAGRVTSQDVASHVEVVEIVVIHIEQVRAPAAGDRRCQPRGRFDVGAVAVAVGLEREREITNTHSASSSSSKPRDTQHMMLSAAAAFSLGQVVVAVFRTARDDLDPALAADPLPAPVGHDEPMPLQHREQ